jgi:hypothetical protein
MTAVFQQKGWSLAAQRDVPGLTRAVLPVITDEDWMRGVKVLSVGVNGGSAPPAVPHNVPFLWRDEATSSEIIAMWHPGDDPDPDHPDLFRNPSLKPHPGPAEPSRHGREGYTPVAGLNDVCDRHRIG